MGVLANETITADVEAMMISKVDVATAVGCDPFQIVEE
jgi:hypothetical protein